MLAIPIGAAAILLVLMFFFAFCVSQVSVHGFVPLLLACSPGGLAEMSLIALVLQIEAAFVVCYHMACILMVVVGADLACRRFITSKIPLGPIFGYGCR
jgi:uncharacterized membrane protein AbrB (regulator of aidB expression)